MSLNTTSIKANNHYKR